MLRRLSVILISLVAVSLLAVSLLTSPAAMAGSKMEVALQDDDVFAPQYPPFFDFDKALDTAKTLNVTWIRSQVVWANALSSAQPTSRTVPKNIHYSFARWDKLVAGARSRGIHVQLTLTGPAPAWATGNHKEGVFKPDAKKYGAFVKATVKHFGRQVTRYSLWNEPNWIGWLTPVKQQARMYRALYTSAYKAARSVNRKAQILMGETSAYREPGLSTAPLALLRGVLCLNKNYERIKSKHCAPLSANGYAVHPYDLRGHGPTYQFPGSDNVTIGTLSRLTRALDKAQKSGALKVLGAKRLPVYLTEFGYRISGRGSITDAKRSKYLVQAFNMALKNPRVKQLLQFQLVQPQVGPHDFWQAYLVTRDGGLTKTYKALLAFTKSAAAHGKIATPKPF